jgi:hypothetical protein
VVFFSGIGSNIGSGIIYYIKLIFSYHDAFDGLGAEWNRSGTIKVKCARFETRVYYIIWESVSLGPSNESEERNRRECIRKSPR